MNKNISIIIIAVLLTFLLSSCGLVKPVGENSDSQFSDITVTDQVENTKKGTDTSNPADTEENNEPENETVLSFVGVGDNLIYYGNVREAEYNASGSGKKYDFSSHYSDIAGIIKNADISFINQETLMCGEGFELSYYPTFNSPQELGRELVDMGFDIVNISNNHMLDKGGAGLLSTIKFWKEMPVLMIGGYDNEEDFNKIRYYEKDGVKIACLSFTYGTNGITIGKGYDIVIPYMYEMEDKVVELVKRADETADMVLVSCHWGVEYSFKIEEEQKRMAKLLADNGTDVIIGHHPHVIQDVEWIDGKKGKTLCVYSLGNFVGEQMYDYNMVGGMISFDIVKKGNSVSIKNAVFNPTVYHFNSNFYNNHVYLMENYTEELAASHGISAYGNHTTLAKLKGYVTSNVREEFLPEFLKK